MMISKKLLVITGILALSLMLVVLAPNAFADSAPVTTQETALELTLEELAAFNGKNGARAYVAVDGIIYDVTDSAAWKNGDHNGFEAGKDLTEAIKKVSPHGISKLANVIEVGTLKEAALELTLEELAAFNGKNGTRAYVAVDGIIYDVTDSAAWKNGDHNGFEAGKDLTEAIKNVSPHGIGKLKNVVEVGILKEAALELTLEELAVFNGKNGTRAYVAVDGIVYDVTDSAAWKNGDHNGFEAGMDLTKAIKNVSPHGIAKLANVVEVGKLVTQ